MIKRIVQTAGFAGLIAALVLTLLQSLWVTPLILQAETYESAEPTPVEQANDHEHGGAAVAHVHEHNDEAWAPDDGWQRTLSTGGSNLVVAVGFALILAGLFSLRGPTRAWHGLLWGLGGFATFALAPSLGLPPELPGSAAAELAGRQTWWIGTAASTAVGLALIAFGRHWGLRVAGVVLLVIPHVVGAPQPEVHSSLAPEALAHEFIAASLITNAAFWAVLGWAAGWLYQRHASPSA